MNDAETAIIIPIKKFETSKTRLNDYLSLEERVQLCQFLVQDLIEKLSELENSHILIVTSEIISIPEKIKKKTVIIYEDRLKGVNKAIKLADDYIEKNNFINSVVIPIDIPLLTKQEIREIIEFSKQFVEGVCIVPSNRFDGTNILLRKPHSIIDTSYDDNSFYNHIRSALEKRITLKIIENDNLKSDIDTIDDIILVLRKYESTHSVIRDRVKQKVNSMGNRSIKYLLEIIKDKKNGICFEI